jgi:hypothetical protein
MAALSREDREALAEGRLANLRASLRLTPAQEKHWSAFESTMREGVRARAARRTKIWESRSEQRRSKAPLDLAARLQDRAQGLRARADQIEKLATAGKPLFDGLDDGQRRRLGLLFRQASRQRAGCRQFARLDRYIRRLQASRQ